jgi:hypothetical protein
MEESMMKYRYMSNFLSNVIGGQGRDELIKKFLADIEYYKDTHSISFDQANTTAFEVPKKPDLEKAA